MLVVLVLTVTIWYPMLAAFPAFSLLPYCFGSDGGYLAPNALLPALPAYPLTCFSCMLMCNAKLEGENITVLTRTAHACLAHLTHLHAIFQGKVGPSRRCERLYKLVNLAD